MSGDEMNPIAVLAGMGGGFADLALIAALGAGGIQVINVGRDDGFDALDRIDRLSDRLGILDMLFGHDDRPRDSMGFRHPHPAPRRDLAFIDTPKPISKRKARRLRGKGKS